MIPRSKLSQPEFLRICEFAGPRARRVMIGKENDQNSHTADVGYRDENVRFKVTPTEHVYRVDDRYGHTTHRHAEQSLYRLRPGRRGFVGQLDWCRALLATR